MVAGSERMWRIALRAVFAVAVLLTVLCVALLLAAIRNDRAISANMGTAYATVEQVSFDRAIIRYETPDGIAHSPANGVLYPEGLAAGDLVWIEYDTTDPDLARVAGRDASLTLLPLGTMLLFTWLVAGPLIWWIRRNVSAAAAPAPEGAKTEATHPA